MGMLFLFLSNILAQQANTGNDDLQREIFTNDKYRFKVKLNEDEVKYASTKPQNTNIYNLAKSEGLVPSYVMTIFINPKAIAKYGNKLPFPVTQAFDTLMKGGLQFDKDKGTFVFNKGPLVKLWSEDPDQCIRNCIKKKREEEAKKRKENEKNMRKEEEQRKKEQKAREEAEKSSSSDSSDSEKENKD